MQYSYLTSKKEPENNTFELALKHASSGRRSKHHTKLYLTPRTYHSKRLQVKKVT